MSEFILFVVNIYFKCIPRDKRDLWRFLLLRMANITIEVQCILRDFSFVYSSCERVRGDGMVYLYGNGWCVGFINFIFKMDSMDLPILGWSLT